MEVVSCSLGCLWGVSGLGVLLYSCDARLLILICYFNHIYQIQDLSLGFLEMEK